ncbi:MAG: ABC transporter permease [Deltaproteobacteria bacterium]|jgi:peptide/nickel transport system permease protein|nr:ABC transporter permease [Deltaproteobacteria bacterium]
MDFLENAAKTLDFVGEDRRVTRGQKVLRKLLENKGAVFGLIMVLGVIFSAIFAPLISPHDPILQDVEKRLLPPLGQAGADPNYLLGTDQLGRDIVSRLIYGARISIVVSVSAVVFSAFLGTIIGLFSGFYGGKIDSVFMRLADVQLAFPFILLAIAIIAVLGPNLQNIIIVMGITGWVIYARVVRAEVLSLREKEYVMAVRALGGSNGRIIFNHLLPNVVPPIIVIITLEMARMIIMEAALSFLGLGIQPPTPTWGGMLADGRVYLVTSWWLATFPGVVIMLVVLGINLLGNWLRDILDPRLTQL